VGPLECSRRPDIDNGIGGKLNPYVIIVKLSDVNGVRRGTERCVEPHIKTQVEIDYLVQLPVVVKAMPGIQLGDGKYRIIVRFLVHRVVIKMKTAKAEVLSHG